MNAPFSDDYSLNSLSKITTKRYGFDLLVTPRFKEHFTGQAYEEMTALLVRQNAKGAGTFVDIGAHYGFFDVLVGLSNPTCTIIAFEPVAENCEILRKNLELNNVLAQVHASPVSDQPGHATFQVSEASDNSGFIANPAAGVIRDIEVDVVRVDQYLDQISDGPVLVKVDTEGNELKVLDGMRGLIEKCSDLRMVVEFNPRCLEANGEKPEALLERIDQLGFDVFFIDDQDRRYEKYHPGEDWRGCIGDRTHENLFCIRKDRSLNLCFFSHSAGLYGAERSLLELVDSLTANYGSVCTVVLPREGPLQGMLEDRGAATLVVDYHWWCSETLPTVEEVDALMQASCENVARCLPAVERISPDVIVTNTLVIPWGSVAALWLDRPHVWLVREFGQLDHGLAFYFTFQKTLEIIQEASDHIVANSEAVKDTLFNRVDSDRCTVAYPNNISLAEPVKTGRSYFKNPESTKLIISGPVMRSKGQDDAIRAVKRLVQSGRDVELCVIGPADSAFGDGLKALVQTEGLGDRIHFLGFVENVRQVIEQADIGLVCSRHEAFGRVTAEAMLLGRPVIATNTGGTVELVDDGENGFLYSPGDVGQLAERIAFLVDHPEKIRELGEQARKDIARKLAERPLDALAFQICRASKGKRNPNSPQLLRLVLGWQQRIQAGLEEHLLQARTRLGANDVELQSARERSDVLLLEKEQAAQALTAQLAERGQQVRALTAQVGEREEAMQALEEQVDEHGKRMQALETYVAESEQQVQALTVRLRETTASGAWRAALLLTRIHALLAPRNSRRARALRMLVAPAVGIASSLRLRRELALIRASGLFDEAWYMANNRDVAEAKADPARHYLQFGGFEGRDPGPRFSSMWYVESNPDVKAAGANPLVHYLEFGRSEGRAIGAQEVEAVTQTAGPALRRLRADKGLGRYLVRFIHVWRHQGARTAVRKATDVLTTRAPVGTGPGIPSPADTKGSLWAAGAFPNKPLISIVMPTYNSQVNHLRSAVASARRQCYENWELCVCDDGSRDPAVKRELMRLGAEDNRIKVTFSEHNAGISCATNEAAALAEGEFLAFLDHDDELAPDALFWIVSLLNERPETDALYTDQDKIDRLGKLTEPFYKPDWSPWLFRCVMYVGHLLVVRRELFIRLGGLDPTFDGVQDYQFMLRLSEVTDRIEHIPRILYHWRSMPGSVAFGLDEKVGIEDAQVRAVNAHLRRLSIPGIASRHPLHRHRVTLSPLPRSSSPLVSIVVVTKDAPKLIGNCLKSIQERTTYPSYEIVVVDNGTTDPEALTILQQGQYTIVPFVEKFSYSKANNLGVENARGDIVLLLNNDTEVVTPGWLEELVFYLGQREVEIVGPLLLYPDQTVQHAGVVLGFRGTADHVMRGFPAGADGYAGSLCCPREVSAVTGACLMMRKKDFIERGGLDQYYATHYQDLDLCLRVASSAKRILYVPTAVLIHHESATRSARYDVLDRALLLDKWGTVIACGDRFYNPNFSLDGAHYSTK
jgi:FkbM family methyltransferase